MFDIQHCQTCESVSIDNYGRLNQRAAYVQSVYEERNGLQNIAEINEFMKKFKVLYRRCIKTDQNRVAMVPKREPPGIAGNQPSPPQNR